MPRAVVPPSARLSAPVSALVTTLLLVAAAGCGDEPARGAETYVALGDSFTSGAGLPGPTADAACQRSLAAYPHRVAETLGARLQDVSCGGASTKDVEAPQGTGAREVPPQLDAVERGTDLVTVGLGYNDAGFYLELLFACTQAAAADPDGQPCQDERRQAGARDPAAVAADTGRAVRAVLDAVRERAPSAQVLLVGYPRLLPGDGPCAALPLAEGDHDFVRAGFESLDDALEQAAQDAGVPFVDVYAASDGHDICAGDAAWVSGVTSGPEQAAPYHPLEAGQRAVAELVLDALDR